VDSRASEGVVPVRVLVIAVLCSDITGLMLARFITGVGIGALTATATVHLAELAIGRPGGAA